MRNASIAAALLATALSLPLAGCFGVPEPGDVVSQAEKLSSWAQDLAAQAEDVADTLSSIDFDQTNRLVVKDATTGEILREVTDQDEIDRVLSPLSGANGLADAPENPEYLFEVWQPETLQAGQQESELEEVKVAEFTTYEGSSVVTLEVPLVGIRLDLAAEDHTANALRSLVA